MNFPGRHWHIIDEGRIQCDVCPRHCRLHEGQRGLCFVRTRENDQIMLTTYGRTSGFCVDPVEKKPLNHFLPGTPTLSFGTAGCNLTCKFCQNWDISKSREMDRLSDEASPQKIAKAAKFLNCRSVAFTYNDPVIFMEYAIDIAKACHEQNIKTVAVTAGYMDAAARAEFYRYMDAANVDLKGFSEEFYAELCSGHLAPVLETLEYLKKETSVWLEITNLIIPTKNDSEDEIYRMCEWILQHLGPDVPLHFTAFHPDWKLRELPATPRAILIQARQIALQEGLHYVYTGNMHDKLGSSTYCHACGQLLIGRDWYVLSDWNLTEQGTCNQCQTRCAGLFDPKPGSWGAKRLPVQLNKLSV